LCICSEIVIVYQDYLRNKIKRRKAAGRKYLESVRYVIEQIYRDGYEIFKGKI